MLKMRVLLPLLVLFAFSFPSLACAYSFFVSDIEMTTNISTSLTQYVDGSEVAYFHDAEIGSTISETHLHYTNPYSSDDVNLHHHQSTGASFGNDTIWVDFHNTLYTTSNNQGDFEFSATADVTIDISFMVHSDFGQQYGNVPLSTNWYHYPQTTFMITDSQSNSTNLFDESEFSLNINETYTISGTIHHIDGGEFGEHLPDVETIADYWFRIEEIEMEPVPEPSTFLLFALGILGIVKVNFKKH